MRSARGGVKSVMDKKRPPRKRLPHLDVVPRCVQLPLTTKSRAAYLRAGRPVARDRVGGLTQYGLQQRRRDLLRVALRETRAPSAKGEAGKSVHGR